jgi:WD40 repeat protein
MAWSGSSVCVWRVADGALWRTYAGSFQSAGVAANRLMTLEPGPVPIVTNRALSAEFYTEIPLEIPAGRALDADNLLAFAISPRLDAFVGLDRQGNAYLWSGDGQLSTSFPVTEPGSVQFSPTGSVALVGDQLLDVGSGRHQTNAAFDLNDGFIDWGVDDAGAHVTRLTERGEVEIADLKLPDMHRLFTSLGRDARPRLLAVSPDGSRLIVLGLDQDLAMLWRLADAFSESVPLREMREGLPILASFSPDSKELLVSGDGWIRVAAETGKLLSRWYPLPDVPTDCWFTSASFATRNGQLAVGDYSRSIGIFRLDAATPIATLNTPRCNGRAVFNADSSLVATSGPALFRSSDWTELWAAPISPPHFNNGALDLNALDDIQFSPGDQTLLLSHCPDQSAACDHALYSAKTGALVETLPTLHAAQASYSTEGNWIVSGNALLHLPTHESLDFAPSARLSTFAPNGDIISVLEDNTLARFCRVH